MSDHPTEAAPPRRPALHKALDEAERLLGADRVLRTAPDADRPGPLGPNTSLFRQRRVAAVIRPATADQVPELVALFGRDPDSGSLHVISTGRNWGLGSGEPAQDDTVVLDLGGLDRVRAFDLEAGWAVVEPGVTQGQLSELLDGTSRMVNVTSSAAATSILGNALDRGVGLRRQRTEDLAGLEVALPDGTSVRVGWWPTENRTAPVYAPGLGPSTLPLFVQSNLGAVTAAVVRLPVRPEALRVVRLTFTHDVLADATTAIRRWVAQGLVDGVPRIFDPLAGRAYGAPDGEFLVHLPVDGTAESVAALTGLLTAEAGRTGLFTGVSDTKTEGADGAEGAADGAEGADARESARLVERGYTGDPDVSDAIFQAKMGVTADHVDDSAGFLFFLPLLPFTGEAVAHADALLRRAGEETGVRPSATLHILGPDLVDCVVAVKFPRDADSAGRAHRALDLLHTSFAEAGYAPYRLDIDHAEWREAFASDPGEVALTRRLKTLIDPNNAIAAGRYR
ncbi:FAD-binding protein [Streptomyces sp. NPDC008125]|uniref:FAD-binding oxidoreductase n=1 Tax=Streptomyces sp. NPDC008125 TaxID=3364811 RepID=UPI0036EB0EB0